MHQARLIAFVGGILVSAVSVAGADAPGEVAPSGRVSIVEQPYFRYGQIREAWLPTVDGELISRADFLRRTGHGDIIDSNHAKRTAGALLMLGSSAALGVMMYEIFEAHGVPSFAACGANSDLGACVDRAKAVSDRENATHVTPAWVAGGAGVVMLGAALYELATVQRVTGDDARQFAATYNATHVAPYASSDGGGVSVNGRF